MSTRAERACRALTGPLLRAILPLLLFTSAAAAENNEAPACESGVSLSPGVCFAWEALADGFANLRGGAHRGVSGFVQTEPALALDLGTLAGMEGWSAYVGLIGLFGRQPTPSLIGGLAALSHAEAVATLRLSELWVQRTAAGIGSVRLGQLAADAEFATTAVGASLTNGTFGWPLFLSTALPSGGPGYPIAVPGVRLALGDPDDGSGVRLAIFSGDPGGRRGEGTDPQRHNRYGTAFPFNGGALLMGEVVVGTGAPARGQFRPWVAKLGLWRHTGGFDDQRAAPPLEEPPASGILPDAPGPARRHNGNYGAYAVAEATLWRDGGASLGAFARASVTPPDRNLLSFYADAGLAWREPFGQSGDTFSVGATYARAGGDRRAQDRALGLPLRDREVVVEVNYEAQIVPDHLWVRPIVQWISHPNAGGTDDRAPNGRLRDALAIGLRVRSAL
ncbi:carbohydrate porin [Muricoccus radiodurans]|uniref:carbohydrate porin n=1 Tax=Muricoccus radiodurans TaxID=2231721 RepID=UPI003CECBFE1